MARITENQLTIPCLITLSNAHEGFLSTSELIGILDATFDPRGKDNRTCVNRYDSYFSQKVRNMICHRKGQTSFIARGLADYTHRIVGGKSVGGLQITKAGRNFLRKALADMEAALDPR